MDELERERDYYRNFSSELGAKALRLEKVAARAKRETARAWTAARLISQLHRISGSDAFGEDFELRFLHFIIDAMKVDSAALLLHTLDEDAWMVKSTVGFRKDVGRDLVFPGSPEEFFVVNSSTLCTPIQEHLQQHFGMPFVLWMFNRVNGLALLLGNAVEDQHLHPQFKESDRVIVEGVMGALADVLARLNAEKALRIAKDVAEAANQAKSQFLANMSHEIRTPVHGVIGSLELLGKTRLDDRQLRFTEMAARSINTLLTVINDILDFSKIEAGKLDIEHIELNLESVVDDTVQLFSRTAAEKKLGLAYFIHDRIPPWLFGDPTRFKQVLLNLLSNAMKFTETGAVIVNADLEDERGEQIVVRVTVRDSGVGISPAVQERLFDPFSQGDTSTTRRFGGTGLGLAISHELVRLMGGEIGVTSPAGESIPSHKGSGSEFWFTVVLYKSERTKSTLTHTFPDLHDIRILIVDGNRAVGETLCKLSRSLGCDAVGTENIGDALSLLRQAEWVLRPFSVILIDDLIATPDREEFGRQLRDDPRAAETRVITLTSVLSSKCGPQSVADRSTSLLKPVSKSSLARALSSPVHSSISGTSVPGSPASASDADQPMVRVLLTEDNPVNQEILSAMLEMGGYSCDCVSNGVEAVEAIKNDYYSYDLVLMDCQMPEMDGFEATRIIRTKEASASAYQWWMKRGSGYRTRIPIIALTAHAMQGDREQCLSAGMDDYLAKPCRSEELHAILKKWL